MDLTNERDRGRLCRAMEASYRHLQPFRKLVHGLVDEYTGPGYGSDSSRPKFEIILNLMHQTVDAYTMSLVANRPRILVSTPSKKLRPFAKRFQIATNNLIQEIELEGTLRQAVLDAFFCVGVVKLHMADSAEVMLEEGVLMDPGIPYCSNVSLDNFCFDTSAPRWDLIQWAADCYRIPHEDLKSDLYDQEVAKDILPSSKFSDDSDGRLDRITRGEETDPDEVEPMVDLMDVWIPREGKIYTFAMDSGKRFTSKHAPLAVMDWSGPEGGPYCMLAFNDVPENIMPTSPASHLSTLSRLINNLMRKAARRAKNAKDLLLYTPSGADGARSITNANDQDTIAVDDPKEIGKMSFGGVDSNQQAFTIGLVQLFDRMAGNLSAKMGLGPQADTATQEQLIHAQVGAKEAQMQYRVVEFTTKICRTLGYMLWNDQAKEITHSHQVEGTPYEVDMSWRPGEREGQFGDYNFGIDVYSMPYQSPGQRVNAIKQLLAQIYIPMAPLLQQQGGNLNMQKMSDIFAELLNLPQLREFIEFSGDIGGDSGPQGAPAQANQDPRQVVRQNIPTEGTQQGIAFRQQQAWLSQPQEEAPQTQWGQ